MSVDHDDRRAQIRDHFDRIGAIEWDRMQSGPRMRVSFELHLRMLRRFIKPGARVLEVGAGPGRFTIALAELGATIVVSDVSPVQLELNADPFVGRIRHDISIGLHRSAIHALRTGADPRSMQSSQHAEKSATLEDMRRFAAAFGVPISELFENV